MMRRLRAAFVVTTMLAGTLIFTASPASASFTDRCFGYTGTFRDGTRVERLDWAGGSQPDECFGIAPNRTIWHAWPNSGRWHEMYFGGRADQMCDVRGGSDHRTVWVWVYGKGAYASSFYDGLWHRWTHDSRVSTCP